MIGSGDSNLADWLSIASQCGRPRIVGQPHRDSAISSAVRKLTIPCGSTYHRLRTRSPNHRPNRSGSTCLASLWWRRRYTAHRNWRRTRCKRVAPSKRTRRYPKCQVQSNCVVLHVSIRPDSDGFPQIVGNLLAGICHHSNVLPVIIEHCGVQS